MTLPKILSGESRQRGYLSPGDKLMEAIFVVCYILLMVLATWGFEALLAALFFIAFLLFLAWAGEDRICAWGFFFVVVFSVIWTLNQIWELISVAIQ